MFHVELAIDPLRWIKLARQPHGGVTMANESTTTNPPAPPARRRLGRGLGSLISSAIKVDISPSSVTRSVPSIAPAPSPAPPASSASPAIPESELNDLGIRMIALREIQPNPRQPRQHFDE